MGISSYSDQRTNEAIKVLSAFSTSGLLGASSVAQLEENMQALDNLNFDREELARIDEHAVEGGIDLWRAPATS